MSDESDLRAAAERRRRIKHGEPAWQVYEYDYHKWVRGVIDDELAERIAADDMALADAYLALLQPPEDDVEEPN